MKHRYLFAVLCIMIAVAWVGAWAQADYFQRLDPHSYRVTTQYTLKNTGQVTLKEAHINVMIGATSNSPYQQNLSCVTSPPYTASHHDALGNLYGDIVIHTLRPGKQATITIVKTMRNSGIAFSPAIENLASDENALAENPSDQLYLHKAPWIESDAPEIQSVAEQFTNIEPAAARAKAIFSFINANLEYVDEPAYANRGALNGLRTGKGVCTEFAGLFVALCRATGIPARVVSGYWLIGKESLKIVNDQPPSHAWAEFYLPEAGWVPVDPSALVTFNGARVANLKYFASLPATDRHLIWNYGIDAEREDNVRLQAKFIPLPDTPFNNRLKADTSITLSKETVELLD